jgi:uroporphyrinogen-III synthase
MKTLFHIVSTKILLPELVQHLEATGALVTQHNFINTQIDLPGNLSKDSIGDVIVLTSKTAVEAWVRIADSLQLSRNKHRIYCLSEGTKKLVLDKGFRVDGTAANSSLLADEVIKDGNIRSVTYLCGNLRRDNLPDQLKNAGVKVHEVIAYKTELSPIAINKPSDAVLFFSPSAVDSYLSENKAGLSVAFCLGETTAAYSQERGFKKIRVADVPTPAALVKTLINYYKNKKAHA